MQDPVLRRKKYTQFGNFVRRYLNENQVGLLKRLLATFSATSNLDLLAVAYGTDKYGGHNYTTHYQTHFRSIRKKKLNILEIGIGGYDDPTAGGGSLRMWRSYFPNSYIYGIDIHDKSCHDEKRIRTFIGSQVDESFLRSVVDTIGEIDIIIDDGSHRSEHVIKTFEILFPALNQNGIYAIEDLQTSYWERDGGSSDLAAPHTSMNFLKGLLDGLNYEEFVDKDYAPSYYDENIVSLHFYHNLAFVYKGNNIEASNRHQ